MNGEKEKIQLSAKDVFESYDNAGLSALYPDSAENSVNPDFIMFRKDVDVDIPPVRPIVKKLDLNDGEYKPKDAWFIGFEVDF